MEPFKSLVTELLLQRTRASAVAQIYPEIERLLSTPADVLRLGEGELGKMLAPLGLFKRRARSLVEIAREIIEVHGNKLPPSEDALVKLPGVGRYVARAVLCFAFGEPCSIVDANVTRIACRFFDLEDKGDNRRNKHVWKKLDEVIALKKERAREFNWALLDLGALVCTARTPSCTACPLNERCSHFHAMMGALIV